VEWPPKYRLWCSLIAGLPADILFGFAHSYCVAYSVVCGVRYVRQATYGAACCVMHNPRDQGSGCTLLHKFDVDALRAAAKGSQQGRVYLQGRELGFRRHRPRGVCTVS
jgi:hypothetical protein